MGRLALAWIAVALWFAAVAWLAERKGFARAGAEALVLTLLASLWFDSLGHGGWWLLFFLLGVLAALPGAAPTRRAVLLSLVDVGRYVAAGALLVWRLG